MCKLLILVRIGFIAYLLTSLLAVSAPALPKDVNDFLDQREACDHWRGEYGYDEERQADIDYAICQACVGTDKRLANLKQTYHANKEILSRLDVFESDIEPDDDAANAAFCKKTRKPAWLK